MSSSAPDRCALSNHATIPPLQQRRTAASSDSIVYCAATAVEQSPPIQNTAAERQRTAQAIDRYFGQLQQLDAIGKSGPRAHSLPMSGGDAGSRS